MSYAAAAVISVVSDSVPARLLCPWDFPGRNTREGCHALLHGDLPNPAIEPVSLMSPELAGRRFTTSATWEVPFIGNTPIQNKKFKRKKP